MLFQKYIYSTYKNIYLKKCNNIIYIGDFFGTMEQICLKDSIFKAFECSKMFFLINTILEQILNKT